MTLESAVPTARLPSPSMTVLLADEQPVVRRGLRGLLSTIDGITVVAEAGTGQEAVRESLLHRPNVLVLDLRLGKPSGISVVREVLRRLTSTMVLVFTTVDDDESVFAALRAGVRGYLFKGIEPEEVVQAIRSVTTGAAILAPAIVARMVELLSQRADTTPYPFPCLTTREREVLGLIADGLRNSEIADRLNLASKTVSNYISAIFAKLGVKDRTAAVILARDVGLGNAAK